MQPTLNPQPKVDEAPNFLASFLPPKALSDVVLVRKCRGGLTSKQAKLSKGQVICFKHPKKPKVTLVKRLADKANLPLGHCWVESDAGQGYADSSHFGPVPLVNVEGLVTCVVWPPNRFLTGVNKTIVNYHMQ
jgi:inner membrane protease subunit 2